MSNERVSQDMDAFRLQRTSIWEGKGDEIVGRLWANRIDRGEKGRKRRVVSFGCIYSITEYSEI